ncbi:ROK family protein [Mucilaginibacter paludis]|uniref:ROK family protein n=1 Tax=Mucilaginibacter paludis DSM 18603 TaxID=714943 RepID=H1Y4D8_9SPHI|nr:ROK family protein [Mucilaginibacter paludis]EHQ25772.1 ROK family protein [Mucilaginibacter paludis DSM 18603]
MNELQELVLGIDIGGSHITAGLVDMNTQQVLKQTYFRTLVNSFGTAEEILDSWTVIINKVFNTVNVSEKKIGIAVPGPFDYEAGISYIGGNKKYDSLYGLNIKKLLAQKLNIPEENILFMNDAASFLQGEIFAGVAVNQRNVIGLTFGTGLGTATCQDGVVADAGLWNSPLFDGIAEDYISTRWFLKYYFEKTDINVIDVKALDGIAATSAVARAVFRKFGDNVSVFLKAFIERENPEMIVLGGNISKAYARFLPHLTNNLKKQGINIPIRVTKLGELAPLLGAASCWAKAVTA